jgi:hypothetical protein
VITFKDYLIEAKQVGILYHYTPIITAYQLVTNNKLGYGSQVSFTRDKNFHIHHRAAIDTEQLRFVLDGDKLSENYKIKPFDYFYKDREKVGHQGTYDESEERITNGPVKELDRYLIKVQIFKAFLNFRLKLPNNNFYNSFSRRYIKVKTPEDVIKLFEDADCPVELI